MDEFNKHFKHLPIYKVIICIHCQYCVQPGQIKGHLASHHPGIPSPVRKGVQKMAQSLENVAHQSQEIKYPDPGSEPIPELPIFSDGLACISDQAGSICPFVCRSVIHMQKHCKDNHGWENSQKRGGNVRVKQQHSVNRIWITDQYCQRFFVQGAWQKYFKVKQDNIQEQEEYSNEGERFMKQGEKVLEQQLKEVDEYQKRKAIEADDHRYIPNAWLKRTGWAKHLTSLDREQLVAILQPPNNEAVITEEDMIEEGLIEACQASHRLIRKAHQCCRPTIVGLTALEYVNRRETGQQTSEKPYYAEQMPKTIKKYSGRWAKILCWIWRSYKQEGRAKIIFTSRQQGCFNNFQRAARKESQIRIRERKDGKGSDQDQDGDKDEDQDQDQDSDQEDEEVDSNNSSGKSEDGSDSNSNSSGVSNKVVSAQAKTEAACFEFWLAMLDHQLKDNEYESGLLSGLAGLGLDTISGGWMSALNYTPILSAMITVSKALVVYKAHQEREEAVEKLKRQGYEDQEARSEARSVIEGVKEMVAKFMTLTDYGGNPTPLNWMLRLRTYGMTIRYNTAEDGKVRWNKDEISIGRISFTMARLRSMVHGLTATVRDELQEKLMFFDKKDKRQAGRDLMWAAGVPKLDMEVLRDNPAEMTSGWNFLQDPRNTFEVDGKRWLYQRVLKDIKLREKMINIEKSTVDGERGTQTQGAVQKEDPKIIWRKGAVRSYMQAVKHMKEQLLVLIHLTGGQPARGTEILSVQHTNSMNNGGSRGIFIENGLIAFVTGYHKGFGSSGKMKVIHRYIPREVGEIVVYFMWLVQPFINILQMYETGRREFSDFFWEPKPEVDGEGEGQDLGNDLDQEGGSNIQDNNQSDDTDSDRDDTDQQEMEEKTTSNPDGFWDTDRVRRVLQKETYARMGVKVGVIAWRHICVAIIRECSRDKKVHEVLDEDEGVNNSGSSGGGGGGSGGSGGGGSGRTGAKDSGGQQSDIRDLQAGHGTRIAGMIYGRDLMESPFHTITQRQGFRRPADWANMVLVTPEAAVGDEFASFIDRRRAMGQLDRIVIDECHVVLDSRSGWRSQMVELADMTKKQTQLVYLTATLPPSDEVEFLRLMGLEEMEKSGQVSMFRDKTARRNVEYKVVDYEKEKEDEEVKKLVEEKKREYPLPGQIIVYCSRVDQAVRLGAVLNCRVYHRNVGSVDEKRGILSMLTKGTEQVFTATNALGLGIDAPTIRVVIHIGIRQKMRDYAQESGRAGRDGQKSEAIIMRACFSNQQGRIRKDQGFRDTEAEMRQFVEGESCRRIILDKKMDGRVDRLGCEIGEVRCDICKGRPRGTRRQRTVVGNTRREAGPSQRRRRRRRVTGFGRDREDNKSDQELGEEIDQELAQEIDQRSKEEIDQGSEQEIDQGSEQEVNREVNREELEEEELEAWEEAQRKQSRTQERRVEQQSQEGFEIADLESKLEEWQHGCVICRLKRREMHDHRWEDCQADETGVDVEWMQKTVDKMRGMKFERYSGCFDCGVPQSICNKWEEDITKGAGRYKKRRGEDCQYKGVVFRSVMAMIQLGDEEIVNWGIEECERRGIMGEDGVQGLQKWLGARVKIGLVESNEMCRVFQRWA